MGHGERAKIVTEREGTGTSAVGFGLRRGCSKEAEAKKGESPRRDGRDVPGRPVAVKEARKRRGAVAGWWRREVVGD